VPRLANPDPKSGCQEAKHVSTALRVSRRWNEAHAPIVQLAPIIYAEKRERRDVAHSARKNHRFECLSSIPKRARVYQLRILDTDRRIMVPVSNANAVGLRQVISEQEIREIFDILKERTIGFDTQTWNRRYRGFMDKIKTGSIYDVAEVLRDLYRLKANKQLSFGERRMLDTARSLIVKEIAIARKQTEEDVKNEIEAIFFSN
jgi:CarD family transcriptional regulator